MSEPIDRIDVSQLLVDLQTAGTTDGFAIDEYGRQGAWPLLGLKRLPRYDTKHSQQVYLSAGIHGDEPAGPLTLLRILTEHSLPQEHAYYICPLMNPSGMAIGRRGNADEIDLNRDYTAFASEEITVHRDWIHRNMHALDLALHLHEDWETHGVYLYELNMTRSPSLATSMLLAAREHLPIERSAKIDGHRARGGIIRPATLPKIPEGLPEAIYMQQHFGGLNYTLETPSSRPLEPRLRAMQAAALAAVHRIASHADGVSPE